MSNLQIVLETARDLFRYMEFNARDIVEYCTLTNIEVNKALLDLKRMGLVVETPTLGYYYRLV